jgi:hypothetical protein
MTAKEFVEQFLVECNWVNAKKHDNGLYYVWLRRHCMDELDVLNARDAVRRYAQELGIIETPKSPLTKVTYDANMKETRRVDS